MSEKTELPPAISGSKPQPKPAGWWSLPGHEFEGTREGVLKAIAARADVPDNWKRNAAEEIAALGDEYNFITVHAHVIVNVTPDKKKHERIYGFHITGQIKM